jgi:hypothetical protein
MFDIQNPRANFRHAFSGTTSSGNGLATALVKINFAFAGPSSLSAASHFFVSL